MVKQVSIFLENKEGRIQTALGLLEKGGINIRSLSVAENSNYGVLRLIVDKPEEAVTALKQGEIMVSETLVLAVEIPDTPGGLGKAVGILSENNINIEYMYAFLRKKSDHAIVIIRVEECQAAQNALEDNGIKTLSAEELYRI